MHTCRTPVLRLSIVEFTSAQCILLTHTKTTLYCYYHSFQANYLAIPVFLFPAMLPCKCEFQGPYPSVNAKIK